MAPHDDDLAPPAGIDRDNEKPQTSDVSRRDFLKTVGASGVATTIVAQGVPVEGQAAQAQAPRRPAARQPVGRPAAVHAHPAGSRGEPDKRGHRRLRRSAERAARRDDQVHGQQRAAAISRGHRAPDSRRRQSQRARASRKCVVETPANAEYAGKRQELPLGSYAIVPDHPALRISGSFTFTAWIAPTSQRGSSNDSFVGFEGVLTKWAGPNGRLRRFHRRSRPARALDHRCGRARPRNSRAAQALRPWVPAIPGMNNRPQGVTTAWYFVAVTFNAATGARRAPPGSAQHVPVRSDARRHRAHGDDQVDRDQRRAAADRSVLGRARQGLAATSTARSRTRGCTARRSAGRTSTR